MLGPLPAATFTSQVIYLLCLFYLIDFGSQSCSIGDYFVGGQGAKFAVEVQVVLYYLEIAIRSDLCPFLGH